MRMLWKKSLQVMNIPLSENYIKQLHAMLLQYSTKDVRHRGEYKKFPNRAAFAQDT